MLCRYRVRDPRQPRVTTLQGALLWTSALQLQAAALPVAAHAFGLLPAARAQRDTALPLCTAPLHAAAVCASFLLANAVGFAWWVARKLPPPSDADRGPDSPG